VKIEKFKKKKVNKKNSKWKQQRERRDSISMNCLSAKAD
jgi:hypothetical protein